ncbi:hypothetical protein Ahy_A07g031130 isoform D [Arachis hypogaea]|uniref:Uncharacterized protein n=1 Tax=Arachis hypogaea TaxID=3818 RepID=A0A445C300_ARAHY|nr:hypothetical protein Ahy_A07g031130 isoform D [Arachis hypogaea]
MEPRKEREAASSKNHSLHCLKLFSRNQFEAKNLLSNLFFLIPDSVPGQHQPTPLLNLFQIGEQLS